MANTSIRIKRSLTTGVLSSALAGELAYSYASNTMFIGSPDGTGVVNVGGLHYTSQIDNATAAATGSTLVRRDASGNASFNYITANLIGMVDGVAAQAVKLQTSRNFSISGGDITASAVGFDGTANVTLSASLDAVPGLSAGTYGSTTSIPVIGIAANGRVTTISTASISTDLNIAGDSGTDVVNLATDTLTFTGGQGITSTVSNNQVTFDVDTTVVRANTASSNQTIDGDVKISGNLTVLGTQTTINSQTLNIADPIIFLASNNTSDVSDIGFVGHYNDGTNRHAGVVRHAGNREFYIFDNYPVEPGNNVIDIANSDFRTANVHAGYVKANVIGNTAHFDSMLLDTVLGVPSGGTGKSTFTAGQIVIGDGTNSLKQLANTGTAGTYGDAATVPVVTTDVYGRVSGVTNTAIAIDASQVTSGKLAVARGGTNNDTFTSGAALFFDGSKVASLANTGTAGTYGDANTIPVITTDAYGRVSSVSATAISLPQLANGSYHVTVSSSDGTVTLDGAGILLKNGARIKDTSGNAVAFGENAGTISQGSQAVAIGDSAGYNTQGDYAIAIGYGAGNVSQSQTAIAIGLNAGMSSQGYNGVAIGNSAGTNQGTGAVALGYSSGGFSGNYSVAIGHESAKGNTSTIGANAVAIGYKAGYESAVAGSIILNASGSDLSSSAAGLYINPVRYTNAQDSTYDGLVFFNSSTKEVRYSYVLDGGSF